MSFADTFIYARLQRSKVMELNNAGLREKTMTDLLKGFKIFVVSLFAVATLGACAAGPAGPYYQVSESRTPTGTFAPIRLGPHEQTFTLQIDDRTPFGPYNLARTLDMLYKKGYDEVRRQKQADFSIDIAFAASAQENPEVRAGHTLGGALAGAAAGAIIGGALGDPGKGAAIGAASGGALGFVSPAATPFVNIDINIYSREQRQSFHRSATIDLTHVPPPDVRHVIDTEVVRLLQDLPMR